MRHNRVHADFWDDTIDWPDDERQAALYLLTCRFRNSEGLFRFRVEQGALDMRWTNSRLSLAIQGLRLRGWAFLEDGWMLLPKALRWEAPHGPKQCVGAATRVDSVPRDSDVYARFCAAAERYSPDLAEKLDQPEIPHPSPADTLSGTEEGVSLSSRTPTRTRALTPPPAPAPAHEAKSAAAVTAPDDVREALRSAGYDELQVDQSDAAIRSVLAEFRPPDDVDWFVTGQEIRKARENDGRLRSDRPESAIKFIAKGITGFPRIGSSRSPGGGAVKPEHAIYRTRPEGA